MFAFGKLGRASVRGVVAAAFSPLSLFATGEQGAWYDPSDLSTLFQDSAGTIPVTADGQPVGLILDKSGNDNHASQVTSAARPVYRTDGTYSWLEFDGIDDSLSTTAIDFTNTDKMSVFGGFTNTQGGNPYEMLVKIGGINSAGSLYATYHLADRFEIGTSQGHRDYVFSSPSDGVASVNTILLDGALSGDPAVLFESSAPNSSGVSNLSGSAGYFGNYPVEMSPNGYLFGGRIYSIIVRGALSTAQEITDTETWVNGKTGAY